MSIVLPEKKCCRQAARHSRVELVAAAMLTGGYGQAKVPGVHLG